MEGEENLRKVLMLLVEQVLRNLPVKPLTFIARSKCETSSFWTCKFIIENVEFG